MSHSDDCPCQGLISHQSQKFPKDNSSAFRPLFCGLQFQLHYFTVLSSLRFQINPHLLPLRVAEVCLKTLLGTDLEEDGSKKAGSSIYAVTIYLLLCRDFPLIPESICKIDY